MPKVSNNASDKTNEDSLTGKLEPFTQNIVMTTNPVVITGVQRKANVGNFETTDVYCAVALPINWTEALSDDNFEELKALMVDAIEKGFFITSYETAVRYKTIKDHIKDNS